MKVSLVKDRDQLTKSENKICDYVEEYMNNSIYMTVTDIANGCNVGEATVTRFCRKLGFRSFLEFKMTMAQELKNGNINKDLITKDDFEDTIEHLANKIYNNNINLLKNCFENINYDSINEITDVILNSKKIYFVGVGKSGINIQSIYYKFMNLGIEGNCYTDSHMLFLMSNIIKKGDILFVISDSGNTTEINKLVELVQQKEVQVISITGNLMSKLSRISEYTITYPSSGVVEGEEIFQSEINQRYILELIYNNILRKK